MGDVTARVSVFAVAVAVLVTAVSCGSDPRVVDPPSFSQSGHVEWVCFDVETNQPRPLSDCRSPVEGELPENLALHVLVTQQSRGEIAAIEIDDARPSRSQRIDNDVRIPGYTYLAVDESPVAVVVAPDRPETTYVASFGNQSISLMPTALFRKNTLPLKSEVIPPVILPGAPSDMVLSPAGDALLVAFPDLGELGVLGIQSDGSLGDVLRVPLSVPATLAPTALREDVAYQKICPEDAVVGQPPEMLQLDAVCLPDCSSAVPKPWSLTVDEQEGQLLVADAALPVIHRLDISALVAAQSAAELEPFVLGAPSVDVEITPVVPRGFGASCDVANPTPESCVRYVYAIDAMDGSVAVLDAQSGTLLLTSSPASHRPERLAVEGRARDLAVLTPGYDDPVLCENGNAFEEAAAVDELRGVFVAVALADGVVRFVDVWDLDAPCRGGIACSGSSDERDNQLYIKRHKPRVSALSSSEISLVASPSISTRSSSATVNVAGITEAELIPDLLPLDGCPSGHRRAFPLESQNETLVMCALADPWERQTQEWYASWEGRLDLASAGGGEVDLSTGTIRAKTDFCKAGVLGQNNLQQSTLEEERDPEFGLVADRLWIVSELPVDASEACEDLVSYDLTNNPLPFIFEIQSAFEDRVIVGQQTIGEAQADLQRVVECFGTFLHFEVHVGNTYLVEGQLDGVQHRVVADDDGLCIVDTGLNPRWQARAKVGELYVGSMLSFAIAQGAADFESTEGVRFTFPMQVVFNTLGVDAGISTTRRTFRGDGTLPTSLRYNIWNRKLYTVDSSDAGVVQFDLSPIRAESFFD